MLITCATIVQSFMLVITMPLGGITGGTQTILAFNYGAGQPDRVKKAQRFIFLLSAGYTTILFILAQTAGHIFVRLFTSDPALIAEAAKTIKIYTLAVIPLSIQYVIVDGFTGLGKVQLSLPLSFFRKLVYFLPLFLLPRFFGARATFYAEPISDIIAPVVSIFVYAVAMKRILKKPVIPTSKDRRMSACTPGPHLGDTPQARHPWSCRRRSRPHIYKKTLPFPLSGSFGSVFYCSSFY